MLADGRIPWLVNKYRESYTERILDSNNVIANMKVNLKQITSKIGNIVNVIGKTGSNALLDELESLEKDKARIENELNKMRSGLESKFLSEEELKDAYVSVRNSFNDLTDEEKRQLINLYLDKLVMYEDYVEMYLNCGEVVEY